MSEQYINMILKRRRLLMENFEYPEARTIFYQTTDDAIITKNPVRFNPLLKDEKFKDYFIKFYQNNVTGLDTRSFQGQTRLSYVKLPSTITAITYLDFYGCSNLKTVVLSPNMTNIGTWVFQNCGNLEMAELPSTLTNIGENAFYGCGKVTFNELPTSLRTIGNSAFYNCNSAFSNGEVFIPASVTTIGNNPWGGITHIENINVDLNNTSFYSINGVLFGTTRLIYCPRLNATSNLNIPNGITSIDGEACRYCNNLTSVTIPSSVTSIGSYAFTSCSNLNSVTIGNSVTSIEQFAFNSCPSLRSLVLPQSLVTIGENCFRGSSSLHISEIPENVETIGRYSFIGVPSQTTKILRTTSKIEITGNGYAGFNGTLLVPNNLLAEYQADSKWRGGNVTFVGYEP